MKALFTRLQKIELALAERSKRFFRRALFMIHGQSKVIDDQGREFGSLEEARRIHQDAQINEYRVMNLEAIEIVKNLHEKADTL